jgi:hypothetical protein
MADLAVSRATEAAPLGSVAADGRGRERREQPPGQRRRRDSNASPELAAALERGAEAVSAVYEQAPDGSPQVRIVDRATGETIEVLTPAELQALAASNGLPPGLLLSAAS